MTSKKTRQRSIHKIVMNLVVCNEKYNLIKYDIEITRGQITIIIEYMEQLIHITNNA